MLPLFLDIETRSDVDLSFHGLRRYAEHTSTGIICMAFCFGDGPIEFWWSHEPFPQEVIAHMERGGICVAHNADFERHLFDYVIGPDYEFMPPAVEQWHCTMIMALTSGYGAGLDAMATGLGLPFRKNPHGSRLIKEYCAPGHRDLFADEQEGDRQYMKEYNISDVAVMRAGHQCLRPLTDAEWAEYHSTCHLNDRGIPVDVRFCESALGYTSEVMADANSQIAALTGGAMIKATQRNARNEWLIPRLNTAQIKLLEVYRKGEKKLSFDQEHRAYLMEREDLDPDARQLLEYIEEAGSSALKKFSVAAHQHVEGQVHNTFLFNGAGRTGRFSGKGLQPHNMRRDAYGEDEASGLIPAVIDGRKLDSPAPPLARLLRSMITHPKGIYWVDLSSIEGRVAPWLADNTDGGKKLDLFRAGKDIYVETAASMYMIPQDTVDAAARQCGKIAELSLQFGGSHNALIGMARNYGQVFEEDFAREVVVKWRKVNPWAETIWDQYYDAIHNAVLNPLTEQKAGRVTYFCDGPNYLWCRLPSERLLSYPKPRYEAYMTPWDEERHGITFQSHFPPAAGEPPVRIHARGALLFQNSVQGVAADVLREALVVADDAGLDIRGHVHDEIIGVGPVEDGDRLNNIMIEEPWWADELPIETGGVNWSRRYGK